jgi:hypothetical protein
MTLKFAVIHHFHNIRIVSGVSTHNRLGGGAVGWRKFWKGGHA